MSECHLMVLVLFLISLSTAPALNRSSVRDLYAVLLGGGGENPLHKIPVNRKQLGIVLDLAAHLMDMELPKMGAKLALAVRTDICKVLIVKDHYSSLRGQERQFILLLGCQCAQL